MPSQPDTLSVWAEGQPVRLPAHCGTTAAEDLRVRMVLACDGGDVVCIDASDVESIGQAVLQLLVAARAEAGSRFAVVHPSRAFIERVTACRLASALGLAEEESVQ